MKYSEFKAKVEALGYLVTFESYGVTKVMNKSGEWLASDFGIVPYNFMINLCYDNMDLWGERSKTVLFKRPSYSAHFNRDKKIGANGRLRRWHSEAFWQKGYIQRNQI